MGNKSLQEVLQENKMKTRSRYEEQKLIREYKAKRERIINMFGWGMFILACGWLSITLHNVIQDNFDKCVEAHGIDYCERGM